ncbi:rhodocoxin reductase [Moniliophthora roreri]|nr:rhodocoxin reductase [Moniliophthora roreri]
MLKHAVHDDEASKDGVRNDQLNGTTDKRTKQPFRPLSRHLSQEVLHNGCRKHSSHESCHRDERAEPSPARIRLLS